MQYNELECLSVFKYFFVYSRQLGKGEQTVAKTTKKMTTKKEAENYGKLEILHIFTVSNIPRGSLQNKSNNKCFEKEVNSMCVGLIFNYTNGQD